MDKLYENDTQEAVKVDQLMDRMRKFLESVNEGITGINEAIVGQSLQLAGERKTWLSAVTACSLAWKLEHLGSLLKDSAMEAKESGIT